jgi:hypothetical protein
MDAVYRSDGSGDHLLNDALQIVAPKNRESLASSLQ